VKVLIPSESAIPRRTLEYLLVILP
jgi:hypothetical protein